MNSTHRIHDITQVVLESPDDEALDLIADAIHHHTLADSVLILLPLTEDSWICELARGRFSSALLGSSVSASRTSADSRLHFALSQDSGELLDKLTWRDYARGLTPYFLIPGRTAALDQVVTPEALEQPSPAVSDNHYVLTHMIEAGGSQRGVAVIVRFDVPQTAAEPFTDAHVTALEAYSALASVALHCAQGSSAIEDDLRDERDRIARDLHDLAIQELFAVGMQLESIQNQAAQRDDYSPDSKLAQSLELSVRGIEKSITQIREIVQSLRNETSDVTLSQRLRHECAMAIAGLGFAPSLQFHSPVAEIDTVTGELQNDVVAVVRECLANAARHSHATAVAVSIAMFREGVDDVIQVNVSDNGRGIDPAVARRSGLANMRSRARRHMGWVDFYSLEPGTMVSWRATRLAS